MKRWLSLFFTGLILYVNALPAKENPKMLLINEAKKEVGEILPDELKKLIDAKDVIVLDIRESEQRAEGMIWDEYVQIQTFAITRGNLEWEIDANFPNKDAKIVTFCRNGGRGALGAQTLKKMGYKNVKNLSGGLKGWVDSGYGVKTGLGIAMYEN